MENLDKLDLMDWHDFRVDEVHQWIPQACAEMIYKDPLYNQRRLLGSASFIQSG